LPVLAAGVTPIFVIALIVFGTGVEWIAWRPPLLWAHHFGIASNDPLPESGGTALSIDGVDLYIAGYTNRSIAPKFFEVVWQGSAFLARYDSGGHEIWTRTVSSNISSALFYPGKPVSGIAPWSNYVYIAANVNDSSFVMKYDDAGNRIWFSRFGGPQSEIEAISATADGVNVVGSDYDQREDLIQKYNFDGSLVWSTSLNSLGALVDLKASLAGVYVLTVGALKKYDQNGNQVWTQPHACGSCAPGGSLSEDDSGLYVAGNRGSVEKYAADGSVLWNNRFQLPISWDSVHQSTMSAGSSGVYSYLEPNLAGNVFLVKYDSSGKQVWSYALPHQADGWDTYPPPLSAGETGLYLAGSSDRGDVLLEEFSGSSSLVLFGINPPFSFITLGAFVAAVAAGFVLSTRRIRRKMRKRSKTVRPRPVAEFPSD